MEHFYQQLEETQENIKRKIEYLCDNHNNLKFDFFQVSNGGSNVLGFKTFDNLNDYFEFIENFDSSVEFFSNRPYPTLTVRF